MKLLKPFISVKKINCKLQEQPRSTICSTKLHSDEKKTVYRVWCRARNAEHWGQFVLAPAEAQRVYGAVRESYNEHTRNTLKHSTSSHKWWETLKGSIFGMKPIPALRGPEMVW